jgi:hypothetical protein
MGTPHRGEYVTWGDTTEAKASAAHRGDDGNGDFPRIALASP